MKAQVDIVPTPITYKSIQQSNGDYDNKTINTTLAVGAVEGKFEVSLTGGTSYRVKPDIPPGIKGMIPNLEVIYNSQAGNSILGNAWILSGLSSISRAAKDFHHDGKIEDFKFNGSDYFSLDGQILVPYGSSGQYRTVKESYNVAQISWGYNGYTDCPNYFTVETKDGWIMEYGNTPDSKLHTKSGFGGNASPNVISWKVNKITDKYGNYILFKYKNIAPTVGSIPTQVIDEITYTHNDALPTAVINKVKFIYKVRNDINSGYIHGDEFLENYLLSHIESYSGNTLFNTLMFEYAYDHNSSVLVSVNKKNKIGEVLNDTKFKYNEFNLDYKADIFSPKIASTEHIEGRKYADFNGDGYSDYITSERYTSTNGQTFTNKHNIYFNNKDGTFSNVKTIQNVNQLTKQFIRNPISYFNLVFDINGDNVQDILFFQMNNLSQKLIFYTTLIYDKSTNQFIEGQRSMIQPDNKNFFPNYTSVTDPNYELSVDDLIVKPSGSNWLIPGDYDGDGKSEILMNLEFQLHEEWTSSTGGSPIINNYTRTQAIFLDAFSSNYTLVSLPSSISSSDIAVPIDFNGDGIQEILESNGNNLYQLDKTTNSFNLIASSLPIPTYNTPNKRIEFGDFNGDRKTDILVYDVEFSKVQNNEYNYNTNSGYDICYSTGKTYVVKRILNSPQVDIDWEVEDDGSYIRRYFIPADFNYDGKTDILEQVNVHRKGMDGHGYLDIKSLGTHYSTGRAFNFHYNTTSTSNLNIGDKEPSGDFFHTHKVKVADINGDGFPDILHANLGSDNVHTSGVSNSVLYTNLNFSSSKLMSGVKNGYTNEIKINYTRLNHPTNSNYDNSGGISFIRFPYRMISSYQVPNGVGGWIEHSYKYSDLFYKTGKGFLGFREVFHTTNHLNSFDITINAYSPLSNALYTTNRYDGVKINGVYEHLSYEFYEYEFKEYTQSNTGIDAKRYIDLLKRVDKYNYKTDVNTITNYYYDSKANEYRLISRESNLHNGLEIELTQFQNYTSAGSLFANKPQTIIKTYTRSGKPSLSSESEYNYDPTTGALNYEIANKGKACETKTSYDYDLVGNLWKRTILPIGSSASTSTVSRVQEDRYDPSKRFVEKKYNIMGQLENTTLYDPISGVPIKSTDINGLVTDYEYDNWYKLKKSKVLSRSLETEVIFNWESGPELFSKRDKATKKADVITYYDALGREMYRYGTGRFGKPTLSFVTYNEHGQKVTESNDHYHQTETPLVTTTTYDDYGRPSTVSNVNGTTTMSYSFSTGVAEATVTNPQGQSKTTYADASGKTFKILDVNGKTIWNEFNSAGQLIATKINGVKNIEYIYDDCGQLLTQIDISNGTLSYTYDEWGQVKTKKNARNQTESYVYDTYGRKTSQTNPEGVTTYTYVPFSQHGRNQIQSIYTLATDRKENVREKYSYNAAGLVSQSSKTIGSTSLGVSYIYDPQYLYIQSKQFSSGVKLDYLYDNYLNLTQIKSSGKLIYELKDDNSFNHPTEYTLGNGLTTQNAYDQNYPFSSTTLVSTGLFFGSLPTTLLDYSVNIDKPSGNVMSRGFAKSTGGLFGTSTLLSESFNYDAKDRLILTDVNGVQNNIYYDAEELGNITEKDDVGVYHYDKMGKNQVREIENPTGAISKSTQLIDYTSYEQPKDLYEDNHKLHLSYADNQQRIRGVWYTSRPSSSGPIYSVKRLRYYFGDMEVNVEQRSGSTTIYNADYIHYVYGIDGHMVAIIKKQLNNFDVPTTLATEAQNSDVLLSPSVPLLTWNPEEYYFTYTDHLGSILVVTDDAGVKVSERNFDAWGRYRDPNTGAFITSTGAPSWLYRGYTGHEHLDEFVLINMNGRVYDPVVGRFLSTDASINDPENSNTYNRYTYCLNNPLKYTDPSGEAFWAVATPFLIAAAKGAVISGLVYTTFALSNNSWNIGDFSKSVALGAISGAVSYGIGDIVKASYGTGFSMDKIVAGALYHSSSQVSISFLSSVVFGDPSPSIDQAGSIFMSTFVSSFGGDILADASPFGNKLGGDIANSVLSAGVGAYAAWITGGDPIRAFTSGVIIGLTNHAMHKGSSVADVESSEESGEEPGPEYKEPLVLSGGGADELIIGPDNPNRSYCAPQGSSGGLNYSVYIGKSNSGQVRYVGITRQPVNARFGQHIRMGGEKAGLNYRQVRSGNLNRVQARIYEQRLINRYGLPNLINKINSIAPKYWKYYGVCTP